METRNDSNINTGSIVKVIKPPDLLSICNALFGFTAILFVLGGVSEKAIKNALVLILVAAVVDGLDGVVARNIGCSPLGKYLDSLADMVSFGVAPAIVVYVLLKNYLPDYAYVTLAFCGAYVICGMLRLARFDAAFERRTTPKEPRFETESKIKEDFEGFPITGGAIFLASFMLVLIELQLPFYSYSILLIVLMGILCFLMTSRIRYRNIRDKRIVIAVGLVFFTLFFFYLFPSLPLPFVYPAAIIVALTAVYICSPFAAHVFALSKAG
ncbi:MAG: CDP-alcohol phosphatidyltransferase family protein [Halobacteriota archaeon]